jgi:hypothetical protein
MELKRGCSTTTGLQSLKKKVCEVDHVRMNDHYLQDIKKIYHNFRLYKNDTSFNL